MGNRKPNLSNLLAFLPPQEQQPLTMVNQINRSQTSSNASPQLDYGQQYDQSYYKLMQDRAEQVQALQKQMQELQSQKPNAFKEADLSTLLAYGDQLSGSRLAQNYKAPTAAQERKAMIEKLRGEVTKSQQGIADDQLAYLKMKAQEERSLRSENRLMQAMNQKEQKPPELKDWQVKEGTYGKRMLQAEQVFDELEKSGYNRASKTQGALDLVSIGPLAAFTNDQLKTQQQAERNFLTAVLRRESGATISPSEFSTGEKMYFPRAGDSPEIIEQKKQNRLQSTVAMKVGAGPAWDLIPQLGTGKNMAKQSSAPKDLSQMSDAELEAYINANGGL
jgi:hypothetical protein